jgi:hypothetical protein
MAIELDNNAMSLLMFEKTQRITTKWKPTKKLVASSWVIATKPNLPPGIAWQPRLPLSL